MTDRTVLLVTSNGFGMGHLVRQLAIANALGGNVHIMTLSQAAPVAAAAGAVLEYCPSYTSPWLSKRAWHRGYLRDRIIALAEEVRAEVVAFDGVVPYAGLLQALQRLPVARVWIRRGLWRADARPAPLAYAGLFDLVIEPGDLGSPRDAGPTRSRADARHVGVVTQAGPAALLPRPQAAERLGIDPGRLTVLFNVGSNAIPELQRVMDTIAARADVTVLTTKDALGRNRSAADSNVQTVSGVFPLYPYLAAVDLAITSVGYNAAHEFVASGVPTIVVPANNVTDDQRARALAMQDAGVSVAVESDQVQRLLETIERLLDDEDERLALAQAARATAAAWSDGAADAANLLRTVQRTRRVAVAARMRLLARVVAEQVLRVIDHRPEVNGIVMTERIVGRDLGGTTVVEHRLPGRSSGYAQRRSVLAKTWFGDSTSQTSD